jgi:hypothetical protein
MERDDYPQSVERDFVSVVTRRADLRGYGKGEFAAKLWPWMNPKIAATAGRSAKSSCEAARGAKQSIKTFLEVSKISEGPASGEYFFDLFHRNFLLNIPCKFLRI